MPASVSKTRVFTIFEKNITKKMTDKNTKIIRKSLQVYIIFAKLLAP